MLVNTPGRSVGLGSPPGKPVISVVAPVFNEAETVPFFYERMTAVLEGIGRPYELILVDDGSRDASLAAMVEIQGRDPRVKVLSLSRNFGHQVAITAGMDYAAGDAVVVIDSDLQDPPEVIPDLVQKWDEGFEVVYAVRAVRHGETAFKLLTAKLFYRMLSRIAQVDIPQDTGDFRLMDRRAVNAMTSLREHHRFMRGLSAWVGFRQVGVQYVRQERHSGSTKYPFRKMLNLAIDATTSFSYLPLQLATTIGFIIAGISLIGILVTIALRISNQVVLGQATTLVSVLFLGGIQLIFLGVIGEYLGRIYDEAKARPLYLIGRSFGFDETPSVVKAGGAPDGVAGACPTCGQPRAPALPRREGP